MSKQTSTLDQLHVSLVSCHCRSLIIVLPRIVRVCMVIIGPAAKTDQTQPSISVECGVAAARPG